MLSRADALLSTAATAEGTLAINLCVWRGSPQHGLLYRIALHARAPACRTSDNPNRQRVTCPQTSPGGHNEGSPVGAYHGQHLARNDSLAHVKSFQLGRLLFLEIAHEVEGILECCHLEGVAVKLLRCFIIRSGCAAGGNDMPAEIQRKAGRPPRLMTNTRPRSLITFECEFAAGGIATFALGMPSEIYGMTLGFPE